MSVIIAAAFAGANQEIDLSFFSGILVRINISQLAEHTTYSCGFLGRLETEPRILGQIGPLRV